MDTAIIIPARKNSTRLPNKMLLKIGNHSVIQLTYLNALKSRLAQTVVVATDDAEIYESVQQVGGQAVMTSPLCPSGTDRIAEAINQLSIDYELIINVQGDQPVMPTSVIDDLIQTMAQHPEISMITAKTDLDAPSIVDPSKVKVVCDQHDNALYFSRSVIPYPRQGQSTKWYKHLGIYGYRRDFLQQFVKLSRTPLEIAESLEQLRALEHGYPIKVMYSAQDSLNIDTPADWLIAKKLLNILATS